MLEKDMMKTSGARLSRTGQRISSKIGKAIGDYQLIEEGDKILVAVSGGKDSLTMLHLLKARQNWSPVYFEIKVAHIKPDMSCGTGCPEAEMKNLLERIGVPFYLRDIQVLNDEQRTNCFWCSWNRRKALFELAEEAGCNKIALGHHKDDIIETILLNLFYKGEISTMQPRQVMFKGQCVLIRPLCYVEEYMTRKFAQENGFPSHRSECAFGQNTKRQKMKQLILDLQKDTRGTNIKTNIFNSVARVNAEYISLKEEDA